MSPLLLLHKFILPSIRYYPIFTFFYVSLTALILSTLFYYNALWSLLLPCIFSSRRAATDKLVEKIVKHDSWPIQPDIPSPPLLRLTSRKQLWLDLQPADIKSRWRHNWKSAQVVNSHLVCDPTIRQPVLTSLGNSGLCWTVFARNRDTAVPAEGSVSLWRVPDYVSTLSNPVPTKLNGDLSRLHSADEDTVSSTSYG